MTGLTEQQIDLHIGTQIRAIRALRNITQTALARALSVSFQQVQKYERGINRLSAAKLYTAALFLDVPLPAFFEGLELRDGSSPLALTPEEYEIISLIRTHCAQFPYRKLRALLTLLATDPRQF